MQRLTWTLILLVILFPFRANTQTVPYLEKKVTIHKTAQPLALIFKELSTQTGVLFSYNPSQLNDQRKVSIHATKTPLRLVLDELLKGTKCSYKLKKHYVIITYNAAAKEEEPPVMLNGYVYDITDSSMVKDASIYIASGKYSAVSDAYGYFSLAYSKQQKPLMLSVARTGFADTSMVVAEPTASKLKIYITPLNQRILPDPLQPVLVADTSKGHQDTIVAEDKSRFMNFWLSLKQARINMKNINDTLFSDFSFSLVPYISTNKLLSINTVNKYSLNLLVGYSKGVKYVELGGLLNIDNGPVSYAQIAGIGNVVSDTVKGVQIGGVFNTVRTHVKGLQVAAVFNTTQTVDGMQLGGIFNSCSRRVNGVQLGGILNLADTVKGMQLAGVYNYAKNIKGFQLALVNVSDTCRGIPFGLFSFVKHGYHKAELSANELRFVNLGFRSGVERFHNIFFAGFNYFAAKQLWTYGYGLGATFKLKNRWNLTTELSSQQIQPAQGEGVKLSLLNKAFVGIDFTCGSKFRIAIGPSYNALVSDPQSPYYNNVLMLVPNSFYEHTDGQTSAHMWIGGSVSLKFF